MALDPELAALVERKIAELEASIRRGAMYQLHAQKHRTGGGDPVPEVVAGHPSLATHDALGLATDAELTAHAGAADPHTGYRLESADHTHQSTGLQAGQLDHGLALTGLTDDDHTQYAQIAAAESITAVWTLGAGGKLTANGVTGMIVVQTGAGAPSHTADEGTPYWDTTNNKLYVNNNGATAWTEIAGGGGGAVATDTIWDAAGDLAVGTGADTAARLARGTAGFVLAATGSTLAYRAETHTVQIYVPDADVASTTVAKGASWVAPVAGVLTAAVQVVVARNGSATAGTFDVHKIAAASITTDGTGTTIFTTQSRRPALAGGVKQAVSGVIEVDTFAAGDRFVVFVDVASNVAEVEIHLFWRPS